MSRWWQVLVAAYELPQDLVGPAVLKTLWRSVHEKLRTFWGTPEHRHPAPVFLPGAHRTYRRSLDVLDPRLGFQSVLLGLRPGR